jgi:O-antigen/teichoic acid export membrane protein
LKAIVRLPYIQSEFGIQTAALFVLDGLANLIDFAFHFWMGRVLISTDFAILQTLNSVALVYTTASGVFQPVVSRFVAEARSQGQGAAVPAIFQTLLRAAFWVGLILGALAILFAEGIGQWLNLPAWTIRIGSALIFLGAIRPIASGALQGEQNFVAFGFTRLALSLGRILLLLFLVPVGVDLAAAVTALAFGWLVSVLCAFLFLGKPVWAQNRAVSKGLVREAWKLSFYALLGYIAYMSIMSLDLVWVNRNLPGDLAGAYAGLVLMRRIVALLPAVAVTVMFPRAVKALTEGRSSTGILIQTGVIVLAASGALSLVYFLFSRPLILGIFGRDYVAAAPLLGWMGMAMVGVSLSSIWLNYFLAESPRRFVFLLVAGVVFEWSLLNILPASLQSAILAFGATGWLCSLAGLVLYLIRPAKLSSGDPTR